MRAPVSVQDMFETLHPYIPSCGVSLLPFQAWQIKAEQRCYAIVCRCRGRQCKGVGQAAAEGGGAHLQIA